MSDQDDVFDTALLAEAQRDGVAAEADAADSAASDDSMTDAQAAEAADAADAADAEVLDPVAEFKATLRVKPGDWYVVHSYAGYENRVKANLETRIVSLNMEDYIFEIEDERRPVERQNM